MFSGAVIDVVEIGEVDKVLHFLGEVGGTPRVAPREQIFRMRQLGEEIRQDLLVEHQVGSELA